MVGSVRFTVMVKDSVPRDAWVVLTVAPSTEQEEAPPQGLQETPWDS